MTLDVDRGALNLLLLLRSGALAVPLALPLAAPLRRTVTLAEGAGRLALVIAVAEEAEDQEQRDDSHGDGGDHRPSRRRPCATDTAPLLEDRLRGRARSTCRLLMATPELIGEVIAVEPEQSAVGPQEPADVGGRGKDLPILRLERPQILGADLRPLLRLLDVHAHPAARILERAADVDCAIALRTHRGLSVSTPRVTRRPVNRKRSRGRHPRSAGPLRRRHQPSGRRGSAECRHG